MKKKERAREVLRRLKDHYKKTGPFANWTNPLELVVATMLSAQCTDERVNRVTPKLFARYPTAQAYAEAKRSDLERMVYSTGYYKSKAKHLQAMGEFLVSETGAEVPEDFEALIRIPGISKKSACIIAAKVFGKFYGVAVDTHVFRVAPRLDLSRATNRDRMAKDLEKLFPPKEYLNVNEYIITLGRDVCVPRRPKCEVCPLVEICPKRYEVRK
jgi:endonuclease-3